MQLPSYDGEKRFHDRVLIAAPPPGQLAVMRDWLDQNLGAGSWAAAPAGFGGVINDAIAFYFAIGSSGARTSGRTSSWFRRAAG